MNANFYAHQRKLQDKTNTKQVYFSNLSLPTLSETAPEPLSTVPFNRDSDFMGPPKFEGTTSREIRRAAPEISGFGGVVKSQLALEYC